MIETATAVAFHNEAKINPRQAFVIKDIYVLYKFQEFRCKTFPDRTVIKNISTHTDALLQVLL